MESSTVLAFRIFVMLSCLIIVPMAAIFGSAFPEVVKSVLVDRIVAWSTGKPLDSIRSNAEPAGFGAVTPGNPTGPGDRGNWEAPRWQSPATDTATWPSPPAGPQTGVVPAGATAVAGGSGNQPASFAAGIDVLRGAPHPVERSAIDEAPRPSTGEVRDADVPSAYPAPLRESSGQLPGSAPAAPLEQPDRFTAMERKLREQGAVYYLLETWGNEGELYRFHCRMAIANNPNYTRHFEATDRDALKAMSQVLSRVEAWRAGRLP